MDIHIVHLKPMRIATSYGFGESPEQLAWRAMYDWAKPRGLLDDPSAHPIFGTNNPYPTPNNPKYGYEFWMEVGTEVEPEEGIRIEEFFGGSYAVARCDVNGRPESILEGWQKLSAWCKDQGHEFGNHPALELFQGTPDDLEHLVLDLHCPIRSC